MNSFRDGNINILVCTDVAARGIDIKGLEAIINYDLLRMSFMFIELVVLDVQEMKGIQFLLRRNQKEERYHLLNVLQNQK